LNSTHAAVARRNLGRRVLAGRILKGLGGALLASIALAHASPTHADSLTQKARAFQRVATFPVFLNTDVDTESVAEIVAASPDGRLLVYTDSANESLGFVDITVPASPQPAGIVPLGGEPTSVAVIGNLALAAVNTSVSFVSPSGQLAVVDLATRAVLRIVDLGGQPDSVAISPDGRFAAVAIENERDEDLGDGRPPQAPAGFLVIVDLLGPDPALWQTRRVDLVGVADRFPDDPEPEFVDINRKNVAVVSLQENNHLVLVDLPSGRIVRDFSARTADVARVDTVENDLIEMNGQLRDRPREPDAVAWTSSFQFATADEGDLDGGTRGFTLFSASGRIRFEVGNEIERAVTRIGHYPEGRSENKGNETEAVEYARFGRERFLFVGSERSNTVAVYELRGLTRPRLRQLLPTGVAPEGLLAIPARNLLIAAAEDDSRDDGFRSSISIYELKAGPARYPTLVSANRPDRTPIPFAALSGLAADPESSRRLFTVYDSFFAQSRIFEIDAREHPARIEREIVLRTSSGDTVDLDLEGVTVRDRGGFWVVSEGAGSVDDPARPVASPNLLLRVDATGRIEQTVRLPAAVDALQRRFGFEGVAVVGTGAAEQVFVAFQREWVGDPDGLVRIGRFDVATGAWSFFYYPIEDVLSPNGGFVGLSELVSLGRGEFAVIERDNQAGTDARIKRLYRFSVAGLTPTPQGEAFPVLRKTFVRDLIPDLQAPRGAVLEKVEGLAVARDGETFIVTDNDGVDDSNGETQFLRLGPVFR